MTKNDTGIVLNAKQKHTASENQKQLHTEYITFAAIKLIEALYKDGQIDACVFNKILRENECKIDTSQFVMAG